MKKNKFNYKDSGVNIEEGQKFIDDIKNLSSSSTNLYSLGSIGGFSGYVEIPNQMKEPVYALACDGVGTKMRIALEKGNLNTIGIDLVAMCVNELITKLEENEKNDWLLMLVDRFDLESWSYNFPKSENITIQRGFSFRNFLLDEAIAEVAQDGREVTKKTFIASFKADLSIEEIEIIFNRLSKSTDILNFRILRSNAQSIDLEYESYLGPEDAASFLSSMGALTNL